MAQLFNLKDGLVVLNPDVLAVPPFKELYSRDKSKNKESSYKELSFVYFMADFNSPYATYPEDKREQLIKDDFIKDKKWKPDTLVLDSIKKYVQLSETPTMRLVRSVRSLIDRMSDYLATAEVDEESIKTLQDSVDKIAKTVAGYGKLEEAVKKEMTSGTKIRGGKDIGDYER